MLRCSRCGELKPEGAFAFASLATGKRQSYCRACQKEYRRGHYLRNRDAYIHRESTRITGYRLDNRILLFEYLSTHPCVDCGETDVLVLEFDHRDPGEKKRDVGYLAARKPWKVVLAEIAKCDVRCANCHRRRTAAQFSWSRGAAVPALETDARPIASVESPAVGTGTRVCTGCGETKPLAEFSIKNKRNGRRSTRCHTCVATNSRAHYAKNKEPYRARSRRAKRHYRRRNGQLVAELLENKSCTDCGESDPIVLEFDHRDGVTKEDDVARLMASGAWSNVLTEIEKCEIRCANCHRRRTAEQFGWTRRSLRIAAALAS